MRVPDSLMALLDDGIVEEVVRPLMSGKEAQIYVVVSEGQTRVAKIYKESERRNFKNRADYTEGRKVRNSRDARAMAKRSRHGKAQDEAAWRSTEVDMIYRLQQVGVRVPVPYHFIDGVLIMEMVMDAEGHPAPRLGEMTFDAAEARAIFEKLLAEVQRMLCAGVVHGDLSDFNVLMAPEGPVVIDFPQAVHAANNRNARKLLLRDVANLDRFVQRSDAAWRPKSYAEEMWALYESGDLTASTRLTGRYVAPTHAAATDEVFALIEDAREDAVRRFGAAGAAQPKRQSGGPPRPGQRNRPGGSQQGTRPGRSNEDAPAQPASPTGAQGPDRPHGRSGAPEVTYAAGPFAPVSRDKAAQAPQVTDARRPVGRPSGPRRPHNGQPSSQAPRPQPEATATDNPRPASSPTGPDDAPRRRSRRRRPPRRL